MKSIYLLVFVAVIPISFSGCKNRGTKDNPERERDLGGSLPLAVRSSLKKEKEN
jgi:hypothetical protein